MPFWIEFDTLCRVRALAHFYYAVVLVLDPSVSGRAPDAAARAPPACRPPRLPAADPSRAARQAVFAAFEPVGAGPSSLLKGLADTPGVPLGATVLSAALALFCLACALAGPGPARSRAVSRMAVYQAVLLALTAAGNLSGRVQHRWALVFDALSMALVTVHSRLDSVAKRR